MKQLTDDELLTKHCSCQICFVNPCEVNVPGDYAAHDRYWRVNNVTSRRPDPDKRERVIRALRIAVAQGFS